MRQERLLLALLGGALLVGVVLGVGLARLWPGGRGRTLVIRPPEVPDPLAAAPADYQWTDQPLPLFPVPPYARYLKGVRIVLDPGHVGQRDPGGTWKRGPTGLREAEVNLRVARYLRDFLRAAGAEVMLTREEDRSLDLPDSEDLRQRAEVANRARADLLLSIHHNAANGAEPNYTTVFWHPSENGSRAGLCAARHLLTGLNDALRLETHLPCAVLPDAVVNDNGFAVLRHADVPAVLSEASFHSNPDEERRLRDPVYNRREAYGLFLGLARWAHAGLPRVRLTGEGVVRPGSELVLSLDDGLRSRGGWGSDEIDIRGDTLVVRLGEQPLTARVDGKRGAARVTLPRKLRAGTHTLFVDFENELSQHVLHPRLEIEVRGG